MGTRSITHIMDNQHPENEICRIYRQFDGYPEGMGLDLAKLCDVTIVNGIPGGNDRTDIANGMGCLAAQVVKGLKDDIGNVYLYTPVGKADAWQEYEYWIRGEVGKKPTIECKDAYKDGGHFHFTGTAKDWLDGKYKEGKKDES